MHIHHAYMHTGICTCTHSFIMHKITQGICTHTFILSLTIIIKHIFKKKVLRIWNTGFCGLGILIVFLATRSYLPSETAWIYPES